MLVGIVSCCKKKTKTRERARLLYVEPSFQNAVQWAQDNCSSWVILSGKHGVVDPEDMLDPYDVDLRKKTWTQVQAWAHVVREQLLERYGKYAMFIVMAEGPYLEAFKGLPHRIKRFK